MDVSSEERSSSEDDDYFERQRAAIKRGKKVDSGTTSKEDAF